MTQGPETSSALIKVNIPKEAQLAGPGATIKPVLEAQPSLSNGLLSPAKSSGSRGDLPQRKIPQSGISAGGQVQPGTVEMKKLIEPVVGKDAQRGSKDTAPKGGVTVTEPAHFDRGSVTTIYQIRGTQIPIQNAPLVTSEDQAGKEVPEALASDPPSSSDTNPSDETGISSGTLSTEVTARHRKGQQSGNVPSTTDQRGTEPPMEPRAADAGGSGRNGTPRYTEFFEEPENPLERRLRDQGVQLDVPPNFLRREELPEDTVSDNLTGLPIEDGEFRIKIAEEFSETIRDGKGWLLFYADADNLKTANTKHGRDFGDMAIKQAAAQTTQLIDELRLPSEVTLYVARQTGAADETVVWLFNLTDEQIRHAREQMRRNDEKTIISDPDFVFSSTTSSVSSLDPEMQTKIAETRQFLNADPDRVAFNLYNEVKQRADDATKMLKIAKDIGRLRVEDIGIKEYSDQIIDIIEDDLGDTRIGRPLLRTALIFTQQASYMDLHSTTTNRERMREALGMSPDELEQLNFTNEDLRVLFYDHILHAIYEQYGLGENT